MTYLFEFDLSAAMTAGMIAASSTAHAGGNNFSSIASNITASIGSLPALLSALAYMFGILLGGWGYAVYVTLQPVQYLCRLQISSSKRQYGPKPLPCV